MSKILIVDDEKDFVETLAKFLSNSGYETLIALNGLEAIDKVTKEKPQIVLLDIKMPEMDGVGVLKAIKNASPKTAVVMVTGVEDEDVAKECMQAGAFDYITKPISLDYLERVVILKLLKANSEAADNPSL